MQNIEEKRAEKRLLISNIKLAILNMHKYANRWGCDIRIDLDTSEYPNIFVKKRYIAIINMRKYAYRQGQTLTEKTNLHKYILSLKGKKKLKMNKRSGEIKM